MRRVSDDDFYQHYLPFVVSFVARRVAPSVVDDVVSEVFAVAWRRRADLADDALPWLYRSARNLIGNRYRSDERWTNLHAKMREVPHERPADPADIAGERDTLIRAFSGLGDDDQELLLLAAWEGLTTPEIAEVLDISPGTAAVRLHRARRRLEYPGELGATDYPQKGRSDGEL